MDTTKTAKRGGIFKTRTFADPGSLDINTPNNPTGKVFSREELQTIAELCHKWNAIAITEMEGGQPSAFCRELLILYENGEISGAEMRKRILGKAQGRD